MPDILDTRDLQKRLEELEGYEEELKSAEDDLQSIKDEDVPEDIDEQEDLEARLEKAEDRFRSCRSDFGEDEAKELVELREMADEISEWRRGESLINDNYFQKYAEQFADDIGAIDANAGWPLSHIDWESAADELKSDYSSIEYDGDTYWYRG